MSENRTGSSGAMLAGLIIGGTVGAIAGLLLAPRSGQETRRILKKSADALPELAEDLTSSVQVQADRLSGSALRNWDGTLNRLKEAVTAGLEASQRATSSDRQRQPAPNSPSRSIEPRPSAPEPPV